MGDTSCIWSSDEYCVVVISEYWCLVGGTHIWMIFSASIITGVGSGGSRGACAPPHTHTFLIGGAIVCLCPPLLTPHFYFPLELYVYITMTHNYLAIFIYQLITLWTISINWHRWLLVNNHISKYNSFILVLYRRYINYVSVCPPTFWHLPTPLIIIIYPITTVCIVS